jgi:hypothetical protein
MSHLQRLHITPHPPQSAEDLEGNLRQVSRVNCAQVQEETEVKLAGGWGSLQKTMELVLCEVCTLVYV